MEKITLIMNELQELNFSDNLSVLEWLSKIQPFTNNGELPELQKIQILNLFKEKGFIAEVAKEETDNADKEAIATIQWALHGLYTVGLIHPMFNVFVENWKKQFNKN